MISGFWSRHWKESKHPLPCEELQSNGLTTKMRPSKSCSKGHCLSSTITFCLVSAMHVHSTLSFLVKPSTGSHKCVCIDFVTLWPCLFCLPSIPQCFVIFCFNLQNHSAFVFTVLDLPLTSLMIKPFMTGLPMTHEWAPIFMNDY